MVCFKLRYCVRFCGVKFQERIRNSVIREQSGVSANVVTNIEQNAALIWAIERMDEARMTSTERR